MNKEMEMEVRLWEYIDGSVPDGAWHAKYSELLEVHQMLDLTELEQPSLRFTKNVMEEIAKYNIAPATKNYINNKIIWSIGLFFIIVIAGLLVYGFGQVDWSTGSSNSNPVGIDFSAVDYSPILSNTFVNIFMGLNMVLGLMLLDRFLAKKKNDQVAHVR